MTTIPENNRSLWREAYAEQLYPALNDDKAADVVIIGAGITGLTTAYMLKRAGLTVCVLEKDSVGGGTSGRTTGKVTAQHGLMYEELVRHQGRDRAQVYAAANMKAVQLIREIISDERISCDWQSDDNYVFTTQASNLEQFKREVEVAASLGLPASLVTETALPFSVQAAVKFSDQGKFSAQKYLLGLAKAVHGGGSTVQEKSNVVSIRGGIPCRVATINGKVTAKAVVVATNVPTMPLVARGAYCALEYPTESYVIAATYDKNLAGMYISPDSNHYSILPITVDGIPRLLIGGGGHLSGLRGSKQWRFTRLARYASKHFGLDSFTHAWSDRDYIAYDEIPLIGKLYPLSKNVYVGTAFKKWGLTNGTVAGMLLSDLITDTPNAWAETFTPHRLSPVESIPRAVLKQMKQLMSP